MGSVKNGFGPRAPKFFHFDVKYDADHMSDARPTKGDRALSPRVPVKLHSNSHVPVSGSPAETAGTGRVRKTRTRNLGIPAVNTMANRRHGGRGMYWFPDEGMGQ
jgi:hypothetical protein